MLAWTVGAALTAWLLLWEWWRPRRANRPLRIASASFAALALAALALQPRLSASRVTGTTLVVAPGATPSRIAAVLDSVRPARTYAADGVTMPLGSTALPFRTLHALAERGESNDPVVILGWGLDESELMGDSRVPIRFLRVDPPAGLHAVTWPTQAALGEPVIVGGTVTKEQRDSAWVVLAGPAGGFDSVRVGPGTGGFHLRAMPNAVGPLELTLTMAGGGAAAETLGVSVNRVPLPRLLLLEDQPNFEGAALRRWYAGRGGQLVSRTRVSRDRWRRDFVNVRERAVDRIDASLLVDVDAIVADGGALARLGDQERAVVLAAVRRGVGLVMAGNPGVLAPPGNVLGVPISLHAIVGLDERMVRPVWWPLDGPVTAPVPAEPIEIRPRFGQEALIRDQGGRVLAVRAPLGDGYVVLSVLAAPSRWRFEEGGVFDAYWSALLSAAVVGDRDRWSVAPGAGRADYPWILTLTTRDPHPAAVVRSPSGTVDTVALVQEPLVPDRWTARFWPTAAGWHAVRRPADSVGVDFLVSAGGSIGRTAARRGAFTRAYALGGNRDQPEVAFEERTEGRPIPPVWFAGLFLLAAAYLWVEGRGQGHAHRTGTHDRRA